MKFIHFLVRCDCLSCEKLHLFLVAGARWTSLGPPRLPTAGSSVAQILVNLINRKLHANGLAGINANIYRFTLTFCLTFELFIVLCVLGALCVRCLPLALSRPFGPILENLEFSRSVAPVLMGIALRLAFSFRWLLPFRGTTCEAFCCAPNGKDSADPQENECESMLARRLIAINSNELFSCHWQLSVVFGPKRRETAREKQKSCTHTAARRCSAHMFPSSRRRCACCRTLSHTRAHQARFGSARARARGDPPRERFVVCLCLENSERKKK